MGGTGFVGQAVCEQLVIQKHTIRILTRSTQRYQNQLSFPCELFQWDGTHIPEDAIQGVHGIVNLVGQPIFDRRWSSSYKKSILSSRLDSVTAIKMALKKQKTKPEVIVQASAVGFYQGRQPTEEKSENSDCGEGFLAETCIAWEKATEELSSISRLVTIRIGLVLGWEGGAFPQLWDIYSSGVGAQLGHGEQWMNWIHIQDLCNIFTTALENSNMVGPYNAVAPDNITNTEFHHALCEHTASPSWLKTPQLALYTTMGKRAILVLEGSKVIPKKLHDEKFRFRLPSFQYALESLLSERFHPSAHYLKVKQWVPASLDKVWSFMSSAQNLEKITPKELSFKITECSTKDIEQDTRFTYALKLHGIPFQWKSHISTWEPKSRFVDEQTKGPYKTWFHNHIFTPMGDGILIEDRIEYSLPFFPFGQIPHPIVRKELDKIFSYRKKMIANIISL